MSSKKECVVVAMSGGIDSSVSAAILVEQGYEVTGVMLRLWSEPGYFPTARRDNRCCTRDQMIDAHLVARKLGIPFEIIDAQEIFKRQVVDRFIEDYSRGVTPNPCLACNRDVRFTYLLNEALARGAGYLATGHYARVTQAPSGIYELRKGIDPEKDQSYVLSVLNQRQLRHAMFPVGGYTKRAVRELAQSLGLPVASKGESQDLCFVADGNYRRFLRDLAPQSQRPGPIRLWSGRILGQHNGLPNYTIGQRKGLGISWTEALYVISKDLVDNSLIVGTWGELGREHLQAHDVNWIDGVPPTNEIQVEVKIRYKARLVTARAKAATNTQADIWLDELLPDITPGQGVVMYDGDKVVASGIIASEI